MQALAILLPILVVQDIVSIWWYRRDWDGWNLKVMLPGAAVGVGLAWAVGSTVPDDVVRLIIGLIFGFWLVLRTPTELFYRIAYALMFLVSAAIMAQGVTGLLRG